MTDARSDKTASANVTAELRLAGAGPEQANARHAEPHGKSAAAAAATIDELLAKEALANLKRTRATAHLETLKSQARMQIPPAKLVVRPAAPNAWKTPFISLAVIVGISTSLCAGGLANLFLQPVTVANLGRPSPDLGAFLQSMRLRITALSSHPTRSCATAKTFAVVAFDLLAIV
jgi:hypothetical protein